MNSWCQHLKNQIYSEYCCKCDSGLTLLSDQERIAELLGYSAEDMESVFHNCLREMIEESGREELAVQLAAGADIELILPFRHRSGEPVWFLNRGKCFLDADGQECLAGILVEVSRIQQQYMGQEREVDALRKKASLDSLTKIYNAHTTRKLAEEYLAARDPSMKCAVLVIDLDDFKPVNDHYGHMYGDEVLIQSARIIGKLFRSRDIVGRIGGEEFLVLMKDFPDEGIVYKRCSELLRSFRAMYDGEKFLNRLTCSIGVACAPLHGTEYEELFLRADQALYQAKRNGKDQFVFYENRE